MLTVPSLMIELCKIVGLTEFAECPDVPRPARGEYPSKEFLSAQWNKR